jgi:hypothetical protein
MEGGRPGLMESMLTRCCAELGHVLFWRDESFSRGVDEVY